MRGSGAAKNSPLARARADLTIETAAGAVHVVHWPGAGGPTVFLHGLGGAAADWSDVVDRLPDADCYALDLPGFGESPPPAHGRYGLADHAASVAAVIGLLDVGPVRLVGNSLGGAVALRLAASRPDLVGSLALLCPALPDLRVRRTVAELLVVLLPFVGPAVLHRLSHGDPAKLAERIVATCYGNPAGVVPSRREAEAELIMRRAALPHADTVYRASLRGLVASNLARGAEAPWRLAARIGVPVLVVYGGRDRLVDSRMAARAQAAFPDVRVVVLERSGHLPHLECAGEVASLLSADPGEGNQGHPWDR
jgi:pimeloyl-ACP methyl ester carboxylesterase